MREGSTHLLQRRGAELLGLAGGEGGGHVKRLHHLVVAQALVLLQPAHEALREGRRRLHPVAHLAVTQVGQELAQLEGREGEGGVTTQKVLKGPERKMNR